MSRCSTAHDTGNLLNPVPFAPDPKNKMKISLKELSESVIWLKIVLRKNLVDERLVTKAIAECGELIAIFVSSTRTADGESISSKIKNQHSEIINRQ